MEKAGTGIKRVTDACFENGNTCIFEFTDAFWITIHSNSKVADKVADKVVEKVAENLTLNQKTIIELMKQNQYISARELAVAIGISHRKTQENISKLKEIRIIKRIGPAKGGYWEIIE